MKRFGGWIEAVLLAAAMGASMEATAAPTAYNQSGSVATEDVRRALSYLSANSSGSGYKYTIMSLPTHATLEYKDASGVWHPFAVGTAVRYEDNGGWCCYTPSSGHLGADSFTWKITDPYAADSNVATFSLTVVPNTPPAAKDFSVSMVQNKIRADTKLSYTDPDTGQPFSWTLVSAPAHGNMEWYDTTTSTYKALAAGTPVPTGYYWYYAPTTGYAGADSFTWRMHDGITNSNIATVSLTIQTNTPPVAYDQKMIAVTNEKTSVWPFYSDPDGQTVTYEILTQPAHGTVSNSYAFCYTSHPGYTGTDFFTWRVYDGLAWSAPATCRILVRRLCDRSALHVLLVVRDTLLPEISAEVNRLKTDIENEGYTAEIAPFSGTSDVGLWDFLKAEYDTTNQWMAGAILIGNLPRSRGSYTGDFCFWDMQRGKELILATGYVPGLTTDARHIWVSRFYANGSLSYGDEAMLIKRALQANHDYRTGASRLPHKAWYYDDIGGSTGNRTQYLDTWPETGVPGRAIDAFLAGGELLDETSHGNSGQYDGSSVTAATLQHNIAQVRFALCSSCYSGTFGGVVNNQVFTRNGGNIFSVAGTGVETERTFSLVGWMGNMDEMTRARLNAGETWGDVLAARCWGWSGPLDDYSHSAVFYGDLSVRSKVASSNAMPVVNAFTADKTTGIAPLTATFSASASDSDGSVAKYEWFINGFDYGRRDPQYTTTTGTVAHTFSLAHRYQTRAQVFDNYKALAWKELEVTVGPTPGQPVRVNCGRNLTYFTPGADYTDAFTNQWLHDQAFAAGTWGYSGGNEGYVNAPVANTVDDSLFQWFRTGSSFTYKVPVANGSYWLNLCFADMQSSAAGQRVMDIDVGGSNLMSGLDVYAQMGGKSACVVPLCVEVTDGELTFTVRKNAASPNDAFLNCFEVIPYAGGNRPPLAQSQSVTTLQNTPQAITLTATDADGDPVTFALATQPAHGTVSGVAPNVVYTPTNGYVGPDQFTFKANDGKTDGNVAAVAITVGGLLAHWPLDETSGTAAADASGHGYGGTLQSTAAWTTGGKINGALQLSGANDMFLASPAVPLAPDWTICAWFSAPLSNTATWHTLTRAQNDNHHIITDGSLNLGMYDNAGGGGFRGCGYNLGGLSNGWHHLAAVGSGTTTRFYVDGAFVGASDRNSSTTVYAVGNYQGGGQRFSDKIDDVRVYNYALSAAELAALAGGGDSGVDAYGIPNSWKIQYFGSVTAPGSAALYDPDHDGMNNLAEYKAGTIPTNRLSLLKISGCRWGGGSDFVMVWSSVAGKSYAIRGTTNLLLGFPALVTNHIPGVPPANCQTVAVDQAVQRFYRVVVE